MARHQMIKTEIMTTRTGQGKILIGRRCGTMERAAAAKHAALGDAAQCRQNFPAVMLAGLDHVAGIARTVLGKE